MFERTNASNDCNLTNNTKMASDFGLRKTKFVLVVVVGCFAILWPKVFYPILVGSANQHLKPSDIDKMAGCCDVFSENDINTIKIMVELCRNIIEQSVLKTLTDKQIVSRCKEIVLKTCGMDISAVLQEQIRLGRSVKHILNEVRSLNGSLCLKHNFGIPPWRLGVPHRITVNLMSNIRQERRPHLRTDVDVVHPAFRERGSAIPKPQETTQRTMPRIVKGSPGPIPGMRPPMGGAGHIVSPTQKGGSSMNVIMPIYTIGIVIFFTYTLMKLLFKKQPDGIGGSLYPAVEPDTKFRKEVFESEVCRMAHRYSKDISSKIVVNAMSALLDEVDEEFESRRRANEASYQANSIKHSSVDINCHDAKSHEEQQTSVKVLGMEMTATCEGGEKWEKKNEPVLKTTPQPVSQELPQEIYLEGALPSQSQILVTESATETQTITSGAPLDSAVVLAGKMTLSVISCDSAQDGGDEAINTHELVEINGKKEYLDELSEESKYLTVSGSAENDTFNKENTDTEDDIDEEPNNVNVRDTVYFLQTTSPEE